MQTRRSISALIFCLAMSAGSGSAQAADRLLVYAGAASQPPTEEAAKAYREKTGVQVDVVFGGSGYVLSQMKLAKQGDLYFPGSSDYMEKAKRDGDVLPETEKVIVYLVPSINVQKGNPHHIRTLKDLTKPGLRVAIANPEGVCVGAYAVEILEREFTPVEKGCLQEQSCQLHRLLRKNRNGNLTEAGRCRHRLAGFPILGPGANRDHRAAQRADSSCWLYPHRHLKILHGSRGRSVLYRFSHRPGWAKNICRIPIFRHARGGLRLAGREKTCGRRVRGACRLAEEIDS